MPGIQFNIGSKLDEAGFKQLTDWLDKTNKAQKDAKESGNGMKDAYADIKNELLGFASVAGVLEFFKGCVEEASKLEQSESILKVAVENTGVAYDKVKGQVNEFTGALAEQTRFSKTESMEALSQMVQRTGDLGTAEHLLTDAMGLSIAQHISLTEASNLLALSTTGNARANLTLGRMMGLTKDQAADSATVLGTLHKRYGDLAQSSNTLVDQQAKLKHTFEELQVQVGTELMPGLEMILGFFGKLVKAIDPAVQIWVDAFQLMIDSVVALGTVWMDVITGHWGRVKQDSIAAAGQIKSAMDQLAGSMAQTWGALTDETTKKIPAAIKAGRVLAQKEDDQADATKVGKAKLTQDQILAMAKQHLAEGKRLKGEELQAFSDSEKEKIADAQKSGAIMGKLAVGMLTDQKGAYKDALGSIIDMIAQKTEAAILGYALEGSLAQLAIGNVAGAAAIEGAGAAAAAVVGGLASTAKGALDSGGGSESLSSTSTPSQIMGTGTSSSSSKAAAGKQGPNIQLIVQGHILGEQHYVQNTLLPLISSAVEDYGGRLVASKVG